MGGVELNSKIVAAWREAGNDLGIAVLAPAELRDTSGRPFLCEAFVPGFGSPAGALVVSARRERRLRAQLRDLGLWYIIEPDRQPARYHRKHFIDQLVDWGWHGPPEEPPDWWPAGRE